MRSQVSNNSILGVTLLLLVAPVWIDLLLAGPEGPFRYFAADAFYYHTVARNIAELGALSFDQTYPTNGFHPVWQFSLAGLYGLSTLLGLEETTYLSLSVLLSVALVALGIGLLGLAILRMGRDLPAAFVLLPVGFYALLLIPDWVYTIDILNSDAGKGGRPILYGTLWSYMNGMESAPALASYGWLAWTFGRPARDPVRHAAALGGVTAILVLSRLDHVLFVTGFALHMLLRLFHARASREALREFAAYGVCAALPIAGYMVFNLSYADTLLPVSGAEKSSFPIPQSDNLGTLWAVLTMSLERDAMYLQRLCRATQLLIPCVASVAFLVRAWVSPRRDRFHLFLTLTAVGVLVLGLYNTFFVDLFDMGPWYLPVSVVFVSLAVLDFLGTSRARSPLALAACAVICLLVFVQLQRRTDYHGIFANFYLNEAPKIREFYGDAIPRLIEFDDGIIGFSLGYPTMSGFGFSLDKAAHRAKLQNRFDEVALERGFDRAASLVYVNYGAQLEQWIPNAAAYELETEYKSGESGFIIVRFSPDAER